MKTFIVFAAVIAVAASSAIRAGWGQPSIPQLPAINLQLGATAAASGAGQAAAAQNLLEQVSGTADAPATLSSSSGVVAQVVQGEDIAQIASADAVNGASDSIQAIDVVNMAAAADNLSAAMAGGNGASAQNAATSNSYGTGAIAANGTTSNQQTTKY